MTVSPTSLDRESRLFLRCVEEDDIPHRVRWLNDPAVNRTLNFDLPVGLLKTKQWLQNVSGDPTRRDFTACLTAEAVPIGFVGLLGIDWRSRHAEVYGAIGEPRIWGQGYGTEMRRLLIAYAFESIGLNRLYARVWAENLAMIRVNQKCGFRQEGVLRSDVYSHGEYRDRVCFGLLRSEYDEIRGRSRA